MTSWQNVELRRLLRGAEESSPHGLGASSAASRASGRRFGSRCVRSALRETISPRFNWCPMIAHWMMQGRGAAVRQGL